MEATRSVMRDEHGNNKQRISKQKPRFTLLLGTIIILSFVTGSYAYSLLSAGGIDAETTTENHKEKSIQNGWNGFNISKDVSLEKNKTKLGVSRSSVKTEIQLDEEKEQGNPIASIFTLTQVRTSELISAEKINGDASIPYKEKEFMTLQTRNLTYFDTPSTFTKEYWQNPDSKSNSEVTLISEKLFFSYLDDGSDAIAQANYNLQMQTLFVEDSLNIHMNMTVLAENPQLISQNSIELAGISISVKLDEEYWNYYLILYSTISPGNSSLGVVREFQNTTFGQEVNIKLDVIQKFRQATNFSQFSVQTLSFYFTSGIGLQASPPQISVRKHLSKDSITNMNPEAVVEEPARFSYLIYTNSSTSIKLPDYGFMGSVIVERKKNHTLQGNLRINSLEEIEIGFNVSEILLPIRESVVGLSISINWGYNGTAYWGNKLSLLINGDVFFEGIENVVDQLRNTEIRLVFKTKQMILNTVSVSHNRQFREIVELGTASEAVLLLFQENQTLSYFQYDPRTSISITDKEVKVFDYGVGLVYLVVFSKEIPDVFVLPVYMETIRTSLTLLEPNAIEFVRWIKNSFSVSYVTRRNESIQIDQGRWVLTLKNANFTVSTSLEAKRRNNDTRLILNNIENLPPGEYFITLQVHSEKFQDQELRFFANVRDIVPKINILGLNQTAIRIKATDKRGPPIAFAFVTLPNKAVTPTTLNDAGIGEIELFEPLFGNQTFQITIHDVIKEVRVDFSEYENEFLPQVQIIHANSIGNETGEVLLQIFIPPLFGEWFVPIPGGFLAIDITPYSSENETLDGIQLVNEKQLLIKGRGKMVQSKAIITVKAPELFFSIANNTLRGTLIVQEPFNQVKGILTIPEGLKIRRILFEERNITGRILYYGGDQIAVELWPKAPGTYQFDIVLEVYGEQSTLGRGDNSSTPLFMGIAFFFLGMGSLGGSIAIIYKKRVDANIEFIL